SDQAHLAAGCVENQTGHSRWPSEQDVVRRQLLIAIAFPSLTWAKFHQVIVGLGQRYQPYQMMQFLAATLSSNFVRPDEANKAQSMVKDKGKHTFIDKVQVRYVSEDDKYWAELKNFSHKYVHIPEHFLREYDRLLMGGIWAQLDIRHQYDEEQKGKRSQFWIEGLKPIQLPTLDLEKYRTCRTHL